MNGVMHSPLSVSTDPTLAVTTNSFQPWERVPSLASVPWELCHRRLRNAKQQSCLAAAHAVATIVTEVAVAVANGDAAAIVTTRGIGLETSKLVHRSVELGFAATVAVGILRTRVCDRWTRCGLGQRYH